MTFFGATVAEADDAQRAVDSVIEMQRHFTELCAERIGDFEG